VVTLTAAIVAATAITAGSASAAIVFNNLPKPKQGNVPSLGFESDSVSEMGAQVDFGHATTPTSVSVEMASWACGNLQGGRACETTPGATFTWPMTLNIYNVGAKNQPGSLIKSVTENAAIPFRPSARSKCPLSGEGVVGWGPKCFYGKAFPLTFSELGGVSLPEKVILSVAYNTTDYGYAPTHVPSIGEDSLNVGLTEASNASPAKGSSPLLATEEIYLNTTYELLYLPMPEGSAVGTFSLAAEWGTYQPEFKVVGSKH